MRSTLVLLSFVSLAGPSPMQWGILEESEKFVAIVLGKYERDNCSSVVSPMAMRHRGLETQRRTTKRGVMCSCALLQDLTTTSVITEESAALLASSSILSASTTTSRSSVGEDATTTINADDNCDAALSAQSVDYELKCEDGFVRRTNAEDYPCQNIDLLRHMPLSEFRFSGHKYKDSPTIATDLWGWTDEKSGREFVIWNLVEGYIFVEVTNPKDPVYIGNMPSGRTRTSFVRDTKVLGNYAFTIGDESDYIEDATCVANQLGCGGLFVFDLRRLLVVESQDCSIYGCSPKPLEPDVVYHGEGNNYFEFAHNIAANPKNPSYIYVMGALVFSELTFGDSYNCLGLYIVDVLDPLNPAFVNCYTLDDYIHDAQCVTYQGPDARYRGTEICVCFITDGVAIVDVTDPLQPVRLCKFGYQKMSFTHQGWLSSDHKYLIFGDEFDERLSDFMKTRTLVLNVSNLKKQTNFYEYFGTTRAIDHNLYVVKASDQGYASKSDLIYQANYADGLRILKAVDYRTGDFEEIAYFDTFPKTKYNPAFVGAFSVYPFFSASGTIVVSSIREGLFLLTAESLKDDALLGSITESPSRFPSTQPSSVPSDRPSSTPAEPPSVTPFVNPTVMASKSPSAVPSDRPFNIPTGPPSVTPFVNPTVMASKSPSAVPSERPSSIPSEPPSVTLSVNPTVLASKSPSAVPSSYNHPPTPSKEPITNSPTQKPANNPTPKPIMCKDDDFIDDE